jgi:DNA-binding SARP family transcriptional activator
LSADCGALRLELLGPVRAWRGERELRIGGPRRHAVLGMLAAQAGHPVRRGELIAGAWGDRPPPDVADRLHAHIAGLRRALEPCRPRRAPSQVLAASGPGWLLRLAAAGLDTRQVDQHVAQARRACAAGDLHRAVGWLDEALSLYRDAPLAGVPGPWAGAERARVAELRLTLLEERTEMLLAMGRHHEVVPDLLGLTRVHPRRERFLGQLMVALYRCGRPADALAEFTAARRLLTGELGPGLRRLQLQILTADTALMTVLPPGSGLPGGRRGRTGEPSGPSGLSLEAAAAHPGWRTAARPPAPPAAR